MTALAALPPRLARPHVIARKQVRQSLLVWCFLLPSLAIFLLYRIIPLLWNLALSFQEWSPLRPARWAGLDHYEEMFFYDEVFWTALWNTLIVIGSAPIGIAMALGLALLVNADIRGRDCLPHHHLHLVSADDRRGRHHLALDVRGARRAVQLRRARTRALSTGRSRSSIPSPGRCPR
jgi:hypothetical protein